MREHFDDMPPMPWNPAAFVATTVEWSFQERGAYRALLDHQWISGSIPASEDRLAALVGLSRDEFACVWLTLRDLFTPTENGRLIHTHLDALRNDVLRLRTARVQGGRKTQAIHRTKRGVKPDSGLPPKPSTNSSPVSSAHSSPVSSAHSSPVSSAHSSAHPPNLPHAVTSEPRRTTANDCSSPVSSAVSSAHSSPASSRVNLEVLSDVLKSPSSSSLVEIFSLPGGEERARACAPARESAFANTPTNGGGGDFHHNNNTSDAIVDPFHPDESWRRDVPECNAEKFCEWLTDLERRRGKPMLPHARLLSARYLASQGDFATQAEIVDFCMMQEYKRLIPITAIHLSRAERGKAELSGAKFARTLAALRKSADEAPGPEVDF